MWIKWFTTLGVAICLVTATTGNLHVIQSVDPTVVQGHLTKSLTVNCSVIQDSNSSIVNAISLFIYRSSPESPGVYKDVVSVNEFTEQIQTEYVKNATVSSHYSRDGKGMYLSVRWDYPQFEMTGGYKCELNGLRADAHLAKVEVFSRVIHDMPDLTDTLSVIQKHDERIESLENMLDSFPNSMFLTSETRDSNTYMVSKGLYVNTIMANFVCKLYGGYLIELNFDNATHVTMVTNMLDSALARKEPVIIGITDQSRENNWTLREHTVVSAGNHIKWASGQPDGGIRENCASLVLEVNGDWEAHDINCFDNSRRMHFVCQVPEFGSDPEYKK